MIPHIHAIIGVWAQGARAFYVQRSDKMQNYPGVWSLLSIQYDPTIHHDTPTLSEADALMKEMSWQRLGGVPVKVDRYLSSAVCSENPMNARVFLHMYAIELLEEPVLASDFYTAGKWMTPDEYKKASSGATCGLCMRMWSDYCVHNKLSEPFAPSVPQETDEE